jgi:hypothetical protein
MCSIKFGNLSTRLVTVSFSIELVDYVDYLFAFFFDLVDSLVDWLVGT